MRELLIAASSILTLVSIVPYLRDILKGATKPRIVSWFTWSLLSAITSAAAFSAHQYPTAILMLSGAVETLTVVVLGWRLGDKKFEKIDVICQAGALGGLALWVTLGSPALAVITTTAIDLIGTVPTLVHSWRKPFEETWTTFLISTAAALCTLLVADNWHITSSLPPVYLLLINGAVGIIILLRRQTRRRNRGVVAAS